jgi:hypothetical protein
MRTSSYSRASGNFTLQKYEDIAERAAVQVKSSLSWSSTFHDVPSIGDMQCLQLVLIPSLLKCLGRLIVMWLAAYDTGAAEEGPEALAPTKGLL